MLFVAFPSFLFSLCLIFVSLINMYLGMFFFVFILCRTLCASWTWVTISFLMLEKVLTILQYFLIHFLFLFFFWNPSNLNVGVLNIVSDVSETVLISFHFFPLCCSASVICSALLLPCSLPVHLNILLPQLLCYWFPLVCFYFSYCIVHCWYSILYIFHVLVKLFMYLLNPSLHSTYLCLHFIAKILVHLYYHSSEF